jgi:hypothetical protein
MRKRVIESVERRTPDTERPWLRLEELAQVEVTSEDPAHPVESALAGDRTTGWRAERPGRQTIRLLFDQPQKVSRISLAFREEERERTQEFVLRWSSQEGQSSREIVRQQYNFSPPGATLEEENYDVALDGVTSLELIINPDISGGSARASLERLDIAS